MAAFYRIRWLPNGPSENLAGVDGNYYELPEGGHLSLDSEPVWCSRCGKVTHGERLPAVEAIDARIRGSEDPASIAESMRRPTLRELPGRAAEFPYGGLADMQRRRKWRASRESAPKCIQCGATDIILLELGKVVETPRGSLQVDCVGFCDACSNPWVFTPEGDRVRSALTSQGRPRGVAGNLVSLLRRKLGYLGAGDK
jgi:hypothetical protein